MKKVTLLSTIALGVAIIGGASQASAEVVVNQAGKETETKVTITDGSGTWDPKDPTQTNLTLETVPTAYNFTTSIKNKDYNLTATLNDKIDVQNDYSARVWSVKAEVDGSQLASGSSAFDVSSFKVNDAELVGTGVTGVVSRSAATPDASNNTGIISKAVTSIGVNFSDPNNVLKAGDELTGTISYSLYNTVDAS